MTTSRRGKKESLKLTYVVKAAGTTTDGDDVASTRRRGGGDSSVNNAPPRGTRRGTSNRRRQGRRRRRRRDRPSSPPRRARRSRSRLCVTCKARGRQSSYGAATNASSSSSVLTDQKRTLSNEDERGMLLGARSFDGGRSTGVEYDREKRINLSTDKKASTATFAKKFVEAYEHEKVEQRRRSGEDTSSSSSSSSSSFSNKNNNLISSLGSSKSKVPIYVIALEDRPEEFEKYEAIRARCFQPPNRLTGSILCNGRTELKTHNMQ